MRSKPLVTLKKRSEFLAVRGALRVATAAFVVEARSRDADPEGPPRFGFTVTKALGGAVRRNRIRRRLKSLARLVAEHGTRPGHDYVLIARAPAESLRFAELVKTLEDALRRVHDPRDARRAAPKRSTIEKNR